MVSITWLHITISKNRLSHIRYRHFHSGNIIAGETFEYFDLYTNSLIWNHFESQHFEFQLKFTLQPGTKNSRWRNTIRLHRHVEVRHILCSYMLQYSEVFTTNWPYVLNSGHLCLQTSVNSEKKMSWVDSVSIQFCWNNIAYSTSHHWFPRWLYAKSIPGAVLKWNLFT